MNTHPITRHVRKSNNYSPSANLFRSLTSSKIATEQPVQFTSVLAHEIRNPLSSINLAVQMLKSMISDNYQKIYLDIIIRSSVRINDMVTDLLTPLLAEGALLQKYSIHELLDEVIIMEEDRILLKNITVTKEYAPQDIRIELNRAKMKIALTNIIINAIDAMPSGRGQLNIVTKLLDGKYVIEIEDNGTGISKKNLKTIFKPYFTNKPGGMGLGLSTTLDILQSNHAKTDVQSEEGKGTRFILSFAPASIVVQKRLKHNSIPIEG